MALWHIWQIDALEHVIYSLSLPLPKTKQVTYSTAHNMILKKIRLPYQKRRKGQPLIIDTSSMDTKN